MTIDGSALNSNVAFARPASPVTTVAVEGGGLFMLDTIAHVASTAFSENSAWADNAAPAGSRVGGGGAAVITETKSAPSALTLTSASFLLNTAGGVPRHLGGALYKDLPSQLEQGDSEVVQMVGDADVQYKSFNDVNLGELVRNAFEMGDLCGSGNAWHAHAYALTHARTLMITHSPPWRPLHRPPRARRRSSPTSACRAAAPLP